MKALVTGGCGFIGSHLVERLLAESWEVSVIDHARNPFYSPPAGVRFIQDEIGNRGALADALQATDVVFHLAWSGIHSTSNQDIRGHAEFNLLSTLSLLDVCLDSGVSRVVFLSSGGTVYGRDCVPPIAETHPTEPVCGYGVTKLATEKYLRLYHHLRKLDYAVIRPSVAYGERQNPKAAQGAVAVFMGKALKGEPITIWGDGSIVRDYVYAGDLAEACLLAAVKPLTNRIYNVSGSEPVSIAALAELVGKVVGKKANIRFEAERSFDAVNLVLDCSRARAELGWTPKVSLAEGLARTLAWMRKTL